MPSGTLIIRADASVSMGTGHVMRCLALAQAWQDEGGRCIFAMAEATPASEDRVHTEKFDTATITAPPGTPQDAAQLVEIATNQHASWVVVDGYQFNVEYQRALKAAGFKVLVIDDTGHIGTYVADLVLDQNPHASESFYQHSEPHTRLLLGSRYAMLRREFTPWQDWKRTITPRACKVLVTMGGSDPENLTLRVIQALRSVQIEGLEVTIVAGGSNPHGDRLEQEIHRSGGAIRLLRNPSNMPELMADADVAISAAGATCWEMCFLALPAVVIDVAENQTPVAQELDRRGIAIHAGSHREVTADDIATKLNSLLPSEEQRAAMSRRGRELVDGRGSGRVVSAMLSGALHLRPAEASDCRLLWQWANDAGVRAAAFSSAAIPWEQHQAWFEDRMKDPNCLILIGVNDEGREVGQVRVDLPSEREGEIDVSVSPDSRGAGYGSRLIDLGVQEVFAKTSAECVHAFIRSGNQPSIRAFERANFVRLGEDTSKAQPALHYCRARCRNPIRGSQ